MPSVRNRMEERHPSRPAAFPSRRHDRTALRKSVCKRQGCLDLPVGTPVCGAVRYQDSFLCDKTIAKSIVTRGPIASPSRGPLGGLGHTITRGKTPTPACPGAKCPSRRWFQTPPPRAKNRRSHASCGDRRRRAPWHERCVFVAQRKPSVAPPRLPGGAQGKRR